MLAEPKCTETDLKKSQIETGRCDKMADCCHKMADVGRLVDSQTFSLFVHVTRPPVGKEGTPICYQDRNLDSRKTAERL